MIKINTILTNAIVLTMDQEFNIFEPGAVAINGNKIIAVGSDEEINSTYYAKEIIDCGGNIVMPGMINAHTHVPMTLLRGLADDLRLDVWLLGYMMPVEREFVTPEFVQLGTKLACIEQIRSGITCFNDMYYYEDDVAQATCEAGMRAVCGQTILKWPTPDASSYEESIDAAREFIQRWKGHELIIPAVAPHAPYTCTEEILKTTAALAVEFDVPLHTHLAETASEVDNSNHDHGMPVIPYVKKHNIFSAKVIAAHCVHVDEGEIHTLNQFGAGIAHNPSSNLKLASGFAPIRKMLEVGLNVGIGTDGPASNNDMDMFEEIRLASFIAKAINKDPTALPAKTTLAMATRIGAEALHLGEITGSIRAGLHADLIIVNISHLHNAPRFQREKDGIYAQLVYAAKSTDVTDVMVNGKWLMRKQKLLTLNESELLSQAQKYAHQIDVFLAEREQSVLSKLIAIEGAQQQESFEVQAKVKIDNPETFISAINSSELEVLYHRHYHEFDTYFQFDERERGLLRHREDEFIDEQGKVSNVRYRLTHIGEARERDFPSGALLSRSRFISPATHSLRFYREYFKPCKENFIEKDRLRWRVIFQGTTFYINLDRLDQPDIGTYLEIKSRTWSLKDAEHKGELTRALIETLGAPFSEIVREDYVELIETDHS